MNRRMLAAGWSFFFVLGVACSGSPGGSPAQQVATPAPGSSEVAGDGAGGEGSTGRKGRRPRPTETPTSGPGGSGSSPDHGGEKQPKRLGPPPAAATAVRSDPSGDTDRSGEPPAYTDIRRAILQGAGRTLRLTLRVDGDIAETLAEGSDMTVNFRLDLKGSNDHQIYAVGGRDGWRADLDNSGRWPGRFAVAGDRFVFELDWSRLGGPARLRWEAESAWTKSPSNPLAQTEFAFDRVPEYEPAPYPD